LATLRVDFPALSYEREVYSQGSQAKGPADLDVLLRKERTWVVEG